MSKYYRLLIPLDSLKMNIWEGENEKKKFAADGFEPKFALVRINVQSLSQLFHSENENITFRSHTSMQ